MTVPVNLSAHQLTTAPPPWWMPVVLNGAAVYNLLWGTLVIVAPTALFRLGGLEPPNYPALVQCLGMVIGVYGIGYAIAARDPVTHWPIVLVGLLGKIFGPIGFVWTNLRGEFPSVAGYMILTNDLIWWFPFAAILVHSIRVRDARRLATETGPFQDELQRAKTDRGESLWDLSQRQPLLVTFVRHSGCPFCRESLDDLSKQRGAVEQAGLKPIVVHMSDAPGGRRLLAMYGLDDVDQICDPDRRLFHAFDLPLASLNQVMGPHVMWRSLVDGVIFRYGTGAVVGSGLQLPGAFIVHEGRIVKAFRHETQADRTNYAVMACPLPGARSGPEGGTGTVADREAVPSIR